MHEEKNAKKSFYRWLGDALGRYPGGQFTPDGKLEILADKITEAELAGLPGDRPLDIDIVRVDRFSSDLKA